MLPHEIHQLSVALIEPEIPGNTGAIGRSCLALGADLHLVRPLGFQITDEQLRRSGLDYWQHVNVRIHDSQEEFLSDAATKVPLWFFSTRAGRNIFETSIETDSMLIFGPESRGLSQELLDRYPLRQLYIPMDMTHVRSLNLSNAVSVALYEAWRQQWKALSAPQGNHGNAEHNG